ncbi:MAG: DUF1320 family protein [Bacteroidales bacterium]|nr:DUF1320 family protein [Bacteroidales bacterium]
MYLEKIDIEKGIQPEILTVISRNDSNINTAINEAVAEMGAYLGARYNIDNELMKIGSTRNTLIVKLVRDIAIYNCYKSSNPVNMPDAQIAAYKDAISFLTKAQAERTNIDGLERLSDAVSGSSYLKYGGNDKRNNHY